MAKDRDNDASSIGQSKRPTLNHQDSNTSQSSVLYSQQQHQTQGQQPQTAQQQARAKSQKHVVGGVARLHARVPSSKALHKHHASAASSSKLNRRQGSPSPDRGAGYPVAPTHRRATSDHKIPRDSSSANLKRNISGTNLKRNRSHVDVGKKSKSSTNLKRSLSNPAVNKVKASSGNKVHFNLSDDEYHDDDGAEDEWIDASASASPHLSRRGSTISAGQTNNNSPMSRDGPPAPLSSQSQSQSQSQAKPQPQQQTTDPAKPYVLDGSQVIAPSLPRDRTAQKEYITSRILQRTPSHGAPPKMSTESVTGRPASLRAHSPDGATSTLSSTPVLASLIRPGSSGKEELTSRFVGNNSQDTKSSIPGGSFLNGGGVATRASTNGGSAPGPSGTFEERPRSIFESVVQTQAQIHHAEQAKAQKRRNRRVSVEVADDTEDDEENLTGYGPEAKARHRGPNGLVRDINRTQQKLNLQRASSSLESSHHPHPSLGIGLAAVAAHAGPLIGGLNCEIPRDPRVGKMLERGGMEYLVVRRYQNPVARSLTRLSRRKGQDKAQRISTSSSRPGTAHAHSRGLSAATATSIGNGQLSARRPPTPRRAFSSFQVGGGGTAGNNSLSSSLENDVTTAIAGSSSRRLRQQQNNRHHHQHHESRLSALSGASLVDDGSEDAGTMAALRNLWDKNLDLSASQD